MNKLVVFYGHYPILIVPRHIGMASIKKIISVVHSCVTEGPSLWDMTLCPRVFPDVLKERCAFFFDASTLEGEDTTLLRNIKDTNSANPHHVLEDLDAEMYWFHYKT